MKRIAVTMFACLAFPVGLQAQADSSRAATDTISAQSPGLTGQDIEEAISDGRAQKGDNQGIVLQRWMGFTVVIHSPITLIRQKASDAAKLYRDFSLKDVTPEMRRPVLTIMAAPYMANRRDDVSSVAGIVAKSVDDSVVIRPTKEDTFEVKFANAFGAEVRFSGIKAEFPLSDLRVAQARNKNGEFKIMVIRERKPFWGEQEIDVPMKKRELRKLQLP